MSREDVLNALNAIKSQAVDTDGIIIKMLLLVMPFCCQHITNIFNQLIQCNTFPNLWKNVDIRPISKVASPNALRDLRYFPSNNF